MRSLHTVTARVTSLGQKWAARRVGRDVLLVLAAVAIVATACPPLENLLPPARVTLVLALFVAVGGAAAALLAVLAARPTTDHHVRIEGGPGVIYSQPRVGRNGRAFSCLKLRSMRPTNDGDSANTWSIASDDRVGPIGRLRRTSIDELPQLWNVLKGDLTLVGPRPRRPHFLNEPCPARSAPSQTVPAPDTRDDRVDVSKLHERELLDAGVIDDELPRQSAGALAGSAPLDGANEAMSTAFTCRLCGSTLEHSFVNLGMSPPCESILRADQLEQPDVFHTLNVRICESCLLVQLPAHVTAEDTFCADYAYFSSYSASWVAHDRRFVERMAGALAPDSDSLTIEVANNDGYLLQHAVALGIPALGIQPAANVAAAASQKGVSTESVFLGERTGRDVAARHGQADLLVANNVLAHVPDLIDFVCGLRALVAGDGVVSLEFQHLLRLIEGHEYDTIYHEHFSYFTVRTAAAALATGGLQVVDIEELPTHGGSVRVFAMPAESSERPSDAVQKVLVDEAEAGLHMHRAASSRNSSKPVLTSRTSRAKRGRAGRSPRTAHPARATRCSTTAAWARNLLPFTVDRNPNKHGMFLPRTHIPVYPPQHLDEVRPDYILILPWNLREEIVQQLSYARDWGARFVVPIPQLEVV